MLPTIDIPALRKKVCRDCGQEKVAYLDFTQGKPACKVCVAAAVKKYRCADTTRRWRSFNLMSNWSKGGRNDPRDVCLRVD